MDLVLLTDSSISLRHRIPYTGADFIVTQLVFDPEDFVAWYSKCRAAGIECPIIPGILPVQSYASVRHLAKLSGVPVPEWMLAALEPIKDDDAAIRKWGVEQAVRQCQHILEHCDVPGFHFYTLNREVATTEICRALGLDRSHLVAQRELPWRPAVPNTKRSREDVRPIYWSQRPKAYISRTELWDEFPNGRWGDADSPAFGSLSDYHLFVHRPPHVIHGKDAPLKQRCPWGVPNSVEAVSDIFVKFVTGDKSVPLLPWNEAPMAEESVPIRNKLATLNRAGFLTINSQPAVNGAPSSDLTHGWGAKGGFVYQKGYLEFFCSRGRLDSLLAILRRPGYEQFTYHAVNSTGSESLTNACPGAVCAVTWGVFPNAEIVQPTVVDHNVFENVWSQEAFSLWVDSWLAALPEDSPARGVIRSIHDEFFLVSIVDNNFVFGDLFAPFAQVIDSLGYDTADLR
jgi:methylenetetrahydrofolate reductase (NADPH)